MTRNRKPQRNDMTHSWTSISIVTALAAVLLTCAFAGAQPATRPTTRKVAPPGLMRGLMTDDVKVLQDLGANSCLLWGPPGKPETWDSLAAAGQFVFLNGLGNPPKELFDFDGKKRVAMRTPFCYSDPNPWRQFWIDHVAAAADKHYPAAHNLTTDECGWNTAEIAYVLGIPQPAGTKFYCDCDQCKKGAGELPEITASRFLTDTSAARQYVAHRYRALADTLQAAQERAKKADPSFLSYYTLNLREVMALERYPYGVALDQLPQADLLIATVFQAGPDRRGDEGRFMQPLVVKHLLAARPRLGAVPALAAVVYDYREKFDWTEAYYWRKEVEDVVPEPIRERVVKDLQPYTLRDDEVILPALSSLAHGARGVMFFGDERKDALRQLFALMGQLEKPLTGATVPAEVVVLCSRQSEDQWMLAHAPRAGSRDDLSDAMMLNGCWAQTSNRLAWEFNKDAPHAQGFRSTQATMEALIRLGVPFRLNYVETLQAEDLAGAKVAIVPFCTHISDKAAALLADPGRKLIAFAHRGEQDENNQPRPTPALATRDLTFFDAEASDLLKDPAGRKKLADAIGPVSPLTLADEPESLERTWLNLPGGGFALFLVNWADQPAQVKAIRLPKDAPATVLDVSGRSTPFAKDQPPLTIPARDARIILQPGR